MKRLLSWLLTAVLFAAVGGLCVWTFMAAHEEGGGEPEEVTESEAASGPVVFHDEAGNVVVTFDHEMQERTGIEVKPLQAASHQPEAMAFGTLEEDPSRSFALRSPLPGIVRIADGARWPALGDTLEDNAVVGGLEPRLGPVERADLAARLATARADVDEATASLEALRASYERKRTLHAENKSVSDQVLQEAEASVKSEEARLQGAEATVHILQSFVGVTTQPADTAPLTVTTGGEVAAVFAQPGEAVESGQPLLRVSRFDRLLARVSLPAGEISGAGIMAARIVVTGREDAPLEAKRVARAAMADAVTGGESLLFAVSEGDFSLQPGMTVAAYLQLPGAPETGVSVPRSAVVRLTGRAWVYVRTGNDTFTRQEVPVDVLTPEGWFVAEGLGPDDSVVVRGAQNLLSEEIKHQTVGGEEEEE
ncbi:MAG: efflux RND transporter periplasmic adaptor subunit [Phycisphaerae bacterium]|nr:efflux RND transporter periplasmic adaptor subunit [Phycisphaerae bacterium]